MIDRAENITFRVPNTNRKCRLTEQELDRLEKIVYPPNIFTRFMNWMKRKS